MDSPTSTFVRPATHGRLTILVVDDNPSDSDLMRRLLERGGFKVIEADSGAAALALFEREPPALVVADIVMPNMTGLDLCRNIRADSQNGDIPILLATGLREEDAIGAAYEAGANDIIGKPYNKTILLHRVRYMLRAANAFRDLHARQHSQKLEALGTLAGGIAHDLNNALVPIMALSKLTSRQVPPGSKAQENLDTIFRASEQARNMVKRVLAFSRNDILSRQHVCLNEVVGEALKLLQATISPMIEIEATFIEVPPILADASQIHQIVANLVSNAAAAIGNGQGKITIAVEHASGAARPGELRLTVADTGEGMDVDTQSRIFQPFFTTKKVGEGTGLGLSVVHGIVLAHNGHIEFKSEPGKGTRFEIYFPIAEIKHPTEQSAA
jgi:signal transduction histidine kinase